ncbi:MAG: M1 family metallopeptidase [Firmicutes bacterium]|nr:M1 family metallopeptidase [Bacillota bacterium]MCL1953314.1 M1 family metallopeptidase [Bacillota bacterium]
MLKKIYSLCIFAIGLLIIGVFVGCASDSVNATLPQYTIRATLQGDSIVANQTVQLVNNTQESLDYVLFNLYPNAYRLGAKYPAIASNEIANAWIDGESYGSIDIESVRVNNTQVAHTIQGIDNNILSVPTTLQPNDVVLIDIDFVLHLPKIRFRMGITNNTINLGQWYPSLVVVQDGKYLNDPYYFVGDPFVNQMANFQVLITTELGYDMVSSGDYKSNVNLDNTKTFESNANNIREFAIVLSKSFQKKFENVGKTKLVYAYYNDKNANASFEIAKKALIFFNNKFGKYPYSQLSVAQTGFVYGGMEYSSLAMISDTLRQDRYNEAIVHEIAHQWWYNIVGNNQVEHAWLDESMAEYSTTVFYEYHPEYGINRRDKIGRSITTLSIFGDMYGNTKKPTIMEKSLDKFDSNLEYVAMVYAKGNIMMDCLRDLLGDKIFFESINDYFQSNAYSIASPDDFVKAFKRHSNQDIKLWIDKWLQGEVILWS